MKQFFWILPLISQVLLGFSATAAEAPCQFTNPPRVFLSGEIHGTHPSIQMQNLMIQGALSKKVYLGLEIDPIALAEKLRPENQYALFGMEESFSKGFGILYWSWWFSEKSWLMKSLSRTELPNAISSFHYFMLTNSDMQKAWAIAKNDPTIATPEFPAITQFVAAVDKSLASKLPPEQAEMPIPIKSENDLAATATVLKAVLRAFVNMGLAETPNTAPKFVPSNLNRMLEILDYPKIVKGERNYFIFLRDFMNLSNRLKQLFVLDWRSEQMGRAILKHLCLQQSQSLAGVPTVAIVGGDHISRMQGFLKANGVNASLDMQGASRTGDFEKLLSELEQAIPNP